MIVKIKRQENKDSAPYFQSFKYEPSGNETVASMLEHLNYNDDLYDTEGKLARKIRWECSCLQKMCGACAMRINGVPALACNSFLKDIKGDSILLEPLSKFPVISDLAVDRDIIQANLSRADIPWPKELEHDPKHFNLQYNISKCLRCGLCLEVCPNYNKGENFYGAILANEAYLVKTLSKKPDKKLKKAYNNHFASGCSLAKSCAEVCPMHMPTLVSIANMNHA